MATVSLPDGRAVDLACALCGSTDAPVEGPCPTKREFQPNFPCGCISRVPVVPGAMVAPPEIPSPEMLDALEALVELAEEHIAVGDHGIGWSSREATPAEWRRALPVIIEARRALAFIRARVPADAPESTTAYDSIAEIEQYRNAIGAQNNEGMSASFCEGWPKNPRVIEELYRGYPSTHRDKAIAAAKEAAAATAHEVGPAQLTFAAYPEP